jgi:PAS domain S-box-containing protein
MQDAAGERKLFPAASAQRSDRRLARAVAAAALALFIAAAPFAQQPLSTVWAGRFTAGFYAGAIYGLTAAAFAVLVLLIAKSRLIAPRARLPRAAQAERARPAQAVHAAAAARERTVFASAAVGILTFEEDGTIASLNPAAERMFALASDAAAGRDVDSLIDLGGAPAPSGMRLRHLLGAGGMHEFQAMPAGGSPFPIDLTLAETPAASGRAFVAFVRDITGRRRAERIKDEFIAAVSQELRTPLTSVAGSLGLLTGGGLGRLPAPAMRLIKIAHTNCQRLVRLVNDILDVERIESGHAAFDFRRVEVKPLVEQAIAATRAFADGFQVKVTLDRADDAVVSGDSGRLAQALANLLSNAIKFSPPEQKVMVAIEGRGDHVRIAVADHGPGLPDGVKADIFEKFAQAEVAGERAQGATGLGLSIVKQIVIRHGGDVGCDDVPGGGTVFHVDLPSWDERVAADTGPHGGAVPILVCEDDDDAADLLCGHLRQTGFAPDVAGTAAQAVAAAAGKAYGAFLVDLHLPDGDGISLIERLRAQWRYRNTPIVVVSATPEVGYEDERSAALRVLDWIRKPVDFNDLARLLP